MSGRPWTTKELSELRILYPVLGRIGSAKRLGRSEIAIRQMAERQKLKFLGDRPVAPGEKNIKARLTDAQCADLRVNRHRLHPGLTVKQIAAIYGVSERTMGGILRGERRGETVWTEEGRIRRNV